MHHFALPVTFHPAHYCRADLYTRKTEKLKVWPVGRAAWVIISPPSSCSSALPPTMQYLRVILPSAAVLHESQLPALAPFKLRDVDSCSVSETLRPGMTTALIHTPPPLASLMPTIWTNSSFLLYGIKALPGSGPIQYFLFPHYIFPDASLRCNIQQGWPLLCARMLLPFLEDTQPCREVDLESSSPTIAGLRPCVSGVGCEACGE